MTFLTPRHWNSKKYTNLSLGETASVLYQKFAKEILTSSFVMPAKAGIQKHPIFLDSGSRWLSPAWPE